MFDTPSFETYLSRRFRRSMEDVTQLKFMQTADAGLIHQYRLLQSSLFINLAGGGQPVRTSPAYPQNMYVMGFKGRHCLAGLQINLKEPESAGILPMERGGMKLASILKHLPVSSVRCAEISGIAIFPDDSGVLLHGLLLESLNVMVDSKVRFAFCTGAVSDLRVYGSLMTDSGYISSIMQTPEIIPTDDNSEVKQGLLVIDLAPAYKNKIVKEQYDSQEEYAVCEN